MLGHVSHTELQTWFRLDSDHLIRLDGVSAFRELQSVLSRR
jgi:hypothetical protein